MATRSTSSATREASRSTWPRNAERHGVDSSRPALETADKNAALNNREIEWIEANAFDLLRDYAAAGKKYETIVLDPPPFAKTKRDLDKALSGYKELNLRALKMLRPGGILVTCSCSFHVSQSGLSGSSGRRGSGRPQIPAYSGEPGQRQKTIQSSSTSLKPAT